MTFSLDANIVSYILRGDVGVKRHLRREMGNGNTSAISIMVYYEVRRGLVSTNATTKLREFDILCAVLSVDTFTVDDVNTACNIYAKRRSQGKPIEDADILIAAQAVNRGYVLVTNNVRHFEDTEGLSIENWTMK